MSVAFILQKFWHIHFWYHHSISFIISIALVQFPWANFTMRFLFPWAKFTMLFHFSLAKFTALFQDSYAWKQCNAMLKLITRTARNNFLNYFLRLPKWKLLVREYVPKLSWAQLSFYKNSYICISDITIVFPSLFSLHLFNFHEQISLCVFYFHELNSLCFFIFH